MTALQYVMSMHKCVGGFFSIERKCARASGSEIRRWIEQSSVVINGEVVREITWELKLPIRSFVLFPKSETRRITIL